jgi:hypothetical protein
MNNREIEIKYKTWHWEESADFTSPYPEIVEVNVKDNDKQFVFGWSVNKWVTDRTFEYPFEVPEGYEVKKKL